MVSRTSCGAWAFPIRRMPTLQPPGSELSAPPSHPSTEAEPSAAKPEILKARPFIFSTAWIGIPSLRPFGPIHCDWPLIAITEVPLRAASLFQSTSRRRLGSFGKTIEPGSLLPSGPSISPNTTLRESYFIASLMWLASLAKTPLQVTALPDGLATTLGDGLAGEVRACAGCFGTAGGAGAG